MANFSKKLLVTLVWIWPKFAEWFRFTGTTNESLLATGIQTFSKHQFFYFMGTLNIFKWKLKINLCFNNYYSFSVLLYVYVCEKVKLRARGSEFFGSQKFWSIYFAFLKRKRINKRKCYRNWCVSGLWYMVGTEMAVDHGNSPPPPPFHLLPHQPTLITLASSNHFFP